VHVIDSQSTTRVEFTDRLGDPFTAAFRPQEALTTQVGAAMVHRINSIGAGPVTGRRFDCAVSTGDNIDSQQHNELDWFFAILDGGALTPNSGAPDRYEGVQDQGLRLVTGLRFYDANYWHPDAPPRGAGRDLYKTAHGFPTIPGLLADAIRTFSSPGLDVPWYSVYGNHDGLMQGNMNGVYPAGLRPLDPVATGGLKVVGSSAVPPPADLAAAVRSLPALLANALGLVRPVTPDARRRAVSIPEWIQSHLAVDPRPGPVGHGYTPDMLETGQLYYTFDVAPGVLGISLDTVNHGGYADGSIGDEQLLWLEQRLVEAHSQYYDAAGTRVTTGHGDRLVVLFSHHNHATMSNPIPDLDRPLEARRGFEELRALLSRFPNVVLWVNGHTHENLITPIADPTGRTGGFWEINTAAHVDYPEQARIVELVANGDGTLSIFAVVVEHAGPAAVDHSDRSVLGLASISRELSANDPQAVLSRLGTPADLNVELLVRAPFAVASPPIAVPLGVGAGLGAAMGLRRRAAGSTS
jgi:metallophosphoesterase (TIGR03767 family)